MDGCKTGGVLDLCVARLWQFEIKGPGQLYGAINHTLTFYIFSKMRPSYYLRHQKGIKDREGKVDAHFCEAVLQIGEFRSNILYLPDLINLEPKIRKVIEGASGRLHFCAGSTHFLSLFEIIAGEISALRIWLVKFIAMGYFSFPEPEIEDFTHIKMGI